MASSTVTNDQTSGVSRRRARGALVALSVATFSYVTVELLPVGLLTVIAPDLGRSRSAIGLLVTGYAVVVVLASVPLTRLTHRVPRRLLLAGTLGLLAVATLVSALAPAYGVLLVARLVTALAQALFWSVVASTATGLFPPEVRGRVVARMAIGTSLAPVLGVPATTWLGQQAGWRAAFAVMAGVALVTCVAVTLLVPTVAPEKGGAARGTAPDARRYWVLVVATTLGVTGALTAYTYVTPFLLDVSGFAPAVLGPLLFISGLAGLLGTLAVGTVLDRYPWAALVAPLALITGALLGLYALGAAKLPAVALLAATGLSFSALASAIQNRVLQIAPGSTDIAGAVISSAFNLGIATGSLLGGALISGTGVRTVPLVGGLFTAVALAVLLSEPRLAGRSGARPATRLAQAVSASASPCERG